MGSLGSMGVNGVYGGCQCGSTPRDPKNPFFSPRKADRESQYEEEEERGRGRKRKAASHSLRGAAPKKKRK